MIFIEGFTPAAALIAVMRCTMPLAAAMLVMLLPQKRRQDRRTPNYVSQSRSLYQRPAAGRNQGRPL
jgi:hypothetical protein